MNRARASEKPSFVGVADGVVCRRVAEEAGDCGRRNGDDRVDPDP
jgi:hypothetical protein